MSGLRKPLTVVRGTAVMLNIVVGAGLLALPGLAFRDAGPYAFLSWVFCAVAAAPLLGVFLILGRRYPDAGGVARFAELAFGRPGYAAASLVLLGAVVFGLPSIALTGGHYAALLTGGSPHLAALALLLAATLMHVLSSTMVARANTVLAGVTITAITGLLLAGLLLLPAGEGNIAPLVRPSVGEMAIIFSPFMMIFFAFTGWEVAAGLSEEFKRPKRDFPLAMAGSFVITVLLYLGVALLVQRLSPARDFETAFAQVAEAALGPLGSQATALLATVVIFANLSGAIWAVSRLVFSLSRERFLPTALQKTRGGTPWLAVAATTCALTLVLSLDWLGYIGLGRMLALAGQNFLVLYGIAALGLLREARRWPERILSLLIFAVVAGMVALQGPSALYPAALLLAGVILGAGSARGEVAAANLLGEKGAASPRV
jgi:amino acid efflux transporter